MKVTQGLTSNKNYVYKAVLFCVLFTLLLVIFSFAKSFLPGQFERLAHGILGVLAALLATLLFLKLDHQTFADVGITFQRSSIVKFLAGAGVGTVLMGSLAMTVIYFTKGEFYTNPGSNLVHFLIMTLPLLPLAFMEELGFRAYPLVILKDKVGVRWSIVITSILFALYHIANGWSVTSSFYGPAVWGLLFGLAAIYSNGIAMPTGMHYACNVTTAAFGAANNTVSLWIFSPAGKGSTQPPGPDWITIGPVIVLLVIAFIAIEVYCKQKIKRQESVQN